jgi:ATP:ADP antiporter, AAA family
VPPVASDSERAAHAATICAALVIAQQVAGKATRDALFLSRFPATALPQVLIASAVLAIALTFVWTRLLARIGPARAVPATFGASAALLLAERELSDLAPRAAAVAVYLHVAALGTLLISGFWSLVSEQFDPRTARKSIGRIAAGGALGGVAGGVLVERTAAIWGLNSAIPLLAALHLAAAAVLAVLAPRAAGTTGYQRPSLTTSTEAVREARYLRDLGLLVFLVTLSGTLVDYVLKAAAAAEYDRPELMMRFFAAFHTGVGLVTFVVQATLSRPSLERWGLARTAATLPGAVVIGGAVSLLVPGLANVAALRGIEAVARNSLFRSAYELFYTPLPPRQKRSAKALIDVVIDRLADIAAGGLIRAGATFIPATLSFALTLLALALSLVALSIARRLSGGYVQALERSLLARTIELDQRGWLDKTTANTLLTLHGQRLAPALPSLRGVGATQPLDPLTARQNDLRSGEPKRIHRALTDPAPLDPRLFPDVIALLDDDGFARAALRVLSARIGEAGADLVHALRDSTQPASIRRRAARLLGASTATQATSAMIEGLGDSRFDVRFECGRSLARGARRGQPPAIDETRAFDLVLREVTVSRAAWQSQRLEDEDDDDSLFASVVLRERASKSLEHVFTLLSLVLPREPLVAAFHGLHAEDPQLRGTALEYLESVLPDPVRTRLWPFLETDQRPPASLRSRDQLVAELKRASETLNLKLRE